MWMNTVLGVDEHYRVWMNTTRCGRILYRVWMNSVLGVDEHCAGCGWTLL